MTELERDIAVSVQWTLGAINLEDIIRILSAFSFTKFGILQMA